jgi:predicted O-methyltransferase YrrM
MKLFDRRGAMTLPAEDYAILLREGAGKKSVLEFGPGFSTYAFIEAEIPRILCCEYLDKYYDFAKERFKDFPQVEIVRFWDEPEARAEIEGEFELALVDSPHSPSGAGRLFQA